MDRTVETYGAVLKALDYIEKGEEEAMTRERNRARLLVLSAISTCPKLRRLDAGKDLDCGMCAFGSQGAYPLCKQVKNILHGKEIEHDGEQGGRGE